MFQESLEKLLPYLNIQIERIVLIINKRIWKFYGKTVTKITQISTKQSESLQIANDNFFFRNHPVKCSQ